MANPSCGGYPEKLQYSVLSFLSQAVALAMTRMANRRIEGFDMSDPVHVVTNDGLEQFTDAVQSMHDSVGLPPQMVERLRGEFRRHQRLEKMLQHSNERLRLLSDVASQLLMTDHPQAVISDVCQKVLAYLDCHAFLNYLVDDKSNRLHLNTWGGIPDEVARSLEWLAYGVGVCGCVAQEGCCIVAEYIPTTPDPRTDLLRSLGVLACACHPLLCQGRVIGTLAFASRTRSTFAADDLSLIKSVSDHIAIAVERLRSQEALRASEERFRKVFEEGPLGMGIADLDRRLVSVNATFCRMLGYTEERELLGQTIDQITHPDDIPADTDLLAQLLQGTMPGIQTEKRYRRKDGSAIWTRATRSIIRSHGGEAVYFLAMIEDITSQRQAEAQLRENAAALRRLSDSNVIGIIQSTMDGIVHANDTFLRIVGYSREELNAGHLHWQQLTPPEYAAQDRRAVQELVTCGIGTPIEKEYIRKDGSRIPVVIGGAKLSDSPLKWIAFVMDLSERKRAERELRRAKEAAELASQAKDHFLAVLSHELRTPLTPVLATAQMMEVDQSLKLPPNVRDSISMIRRNVELEAKLIDDLLDLTRISRGKLELCFRTVDLHEKVRHVIQMCDGDIRSRQLNLVVELAAERHHVQADPGRLQQVLWNLLKNAVKFTPPGGQVTIRSQNPGEGCILMAVKDTGTGIEPEVLPRLFNAFEQGGKEITRQFGGLGLGLAISKGLVELHGGTLSAYSEGKGKGACFTLELQTSSAEGKTGRDLGFSENELAGPMSGRVLLVEDHADSARTMALLLKSYGFEVRVADTIASALRAIQSEEFDLLISDIGLPDGSGLDLMRQVRLKSALKGIAVSGYGMEEDIRKSQEAGFIAHLTKPVSLEKLDRVIRHLQD